MQKQKRVNRLDGSLTIQELSRQMDNPTPPMTTEEKLLYFQNELENQESVFNGDMKFLKEEISKIEKQLYSHIVMLYMKVAKLEEGGKISLDDLIGKMTDILKEKKNARTDKRVRK